MNQLLRAKNPKRNLCSFEKSYHWFTKPDLGLFLSPVISALSEVNRQELPSPQEKSGGRVSAWREASGNIWGQNRSHDCRVTETATKGFECHPQKSSDVSHKLPSKGKNPTRWRERQDKWYSQLGETFQNRQWAAWPGCRFKSQSSQRDCSRSWATGIVDILVHFCCYNKILKAQVLCREEDHNFVDPASNTRQLHLFDFQGDCLPCCLELTSYRKSLCSNCKQKRWKRPNSWWPGFLRPPLSGH